jgi:hypothetical protein
MELYGGQHIAVAAFGFLADRHLHVVCPHNRHRSGPLHRLVFSSWGWLSFHPEWCLGVSLEPSSRHLHEARVGRRHDISARVCLSLSTSAPVIGSGSVFVRLHLHALVSLGKRTRRSRRVRWHAVNLLQQLLTVEYDAGFVCFYSARLIVFHGTKYQACLAPTHYLHKHGSSVVEMHSMCRASAREFDLAVMAMPFRSAGATEGGGLADGRHFRDCSTKMLCRTFRTWHATNWANGHGTHCPRGRVCIRGFERVGRLVAFGIIGLLRWVQVCMPRHISRRVDRRPLLLPLPAHVCCV